MCLPATRSYKIKIQLGHYEWMTNDPIQTGDKFCRWDYKVEHGFEDTYQDLKRMPPIFIYLMDGDYPVCYYKETVLEFLNP